MTNQTNHFFSYAILTTSLGILTVATIFSLPSLIWSVIQLLPIS